MNSIDNPYFLMEAMPGEKSGEVTYLRRRIEELEAKLAKAVEALDEAVYLLRPDEDDMMRQAGVYRIVTTLAELKGQNQ